MNIFLIILGIIALLILIIGFFPIRIKAKCNGIKDIKVHALGIKLYDSLEKHDKDFGFLKQIYKIFVEKAKKYAIINNIEVKYHFGFSDAAFTGIYSGVVYSVVNVVLAFLQNSFKVKKQKIEIIPDFDNKVQEFKADIEATIRILIFLPEIIKFLKLLKNKKRKCK